MEEVGSGGGGVGVVPVFPAELRALPPPDVASDVVLFAAAAKVQHPPGGGGVGPFARWAVWFGGISGRGFPRFLQ